MAAPHRRTSVLDVVKSIGNSDKHLRWSDMPEVRERLPSIGQNVNLINLSEIKFEIISQEASFNIRLRSLLSVFINSKAITSVDRKNLFATMERVLQVSDTFLADLELCWLNDIFLIGIFDVLKKHEGNFDAYVKYCSAQKITYLHMKKLWTEKTEFILLLERWHNSPENNPKIDLDTFLDLPKVRMTSLSKTCLKAGPLIDKINLEYKSLQLVMKSFKKMADKCEQAVAAHGKRVKILRIFDQLYFSPTVKPSTLAAGARELLKIEEMILLDLAELHSTKHPQRHLVLFNDIIFIAKRAKKDERLEIIDSCYIANLELKSTDDLLTLMKDSALRNSHNKLLMIKLNKNHENKPVIHLFLSALETSCTEWIKLLESLILQNTAKPEVAEIRVKEEVQVPEHPLPNRTSREQLLVEELMRRQQARKSEWPESQAALDSIVNELDVIDGKEFHIPRPITGKAPLPRPTSLLPGDAPGVHAKPAKIDRLVDEAQRHKPGVDATVKFDKTIDFPPGMTVFPLVSMPRWLVKTGDMTQRWHHEDRKYSETRINFTLWLFNDVLFLTTRKQGDNRNRVLTYGLRNLADITMVKKLAHLPPKLAADRDGKFMMMIHFLENHRHIQETMVVSVDSESERAAWLAAMAAPVTSKGKEMVYDVWDRPLVMAVEAFHATSTHQLSLVTNDKMHVNRRRADGWYEGERISDGQTGSFPASATVEVDSSHKHAREVRQAALAAGGVV